MLSPDEVAAVFRGLDAEHEPFARLIYGAGMRLIGALQLRVKDVDCRHRTLVVLAGKRDKDRLLIANVRGWVR